MFLAMTDGECGDGDDREPALGHRRTERAKARPSGGSRPGGVPPGKLPRRSDWREATALVPAVAVAGAASRPGNARRGPGPATRRPPLRSTAWLDGPDGDDHRSRSERDRHDPPAGRPEAGPAAGGRLDGPPEATRARPDSAPGSGPAGDGGGDAPSAVAPDSGAPVRPAPLRPRGIPLTPLFGRSREQVTDHDDPFAALGGMTTVADSATGERSHEGTDRSGRRWPAGGTSRARVVAAILAGSLLPALAILAVVRATADQSVATGPRPSVVVDPSDGAVFAPDAPSTTPAPDPTVAETGSTAALTTPESNASPSPAPTTAVAGRSASDRAPAGGSVTGDAAAPPSTGSNRAGPSNAVSDPSGDATPTTTAAPPATVFDPSPAEASVLACVVRGDGDGGAAADGHGVYRLDLATWNAAAATLARPDLAGAPDRASRRDQDLVALRVLRDRGGVWDSRCG
jgi:hypothetical protein